MTRQRGHYSVERNSGKNQHSFCLKRVYDLLTSEVRVSNEHLATECGVLEKFSLRLERVKDIHREVGGNPTIRACDVVCRFVSPLDGSHSHISHFLFRLFTQGL
ncbi:hypothetical protein J6590_014575 [Homalodisca vitripennis]|nr:hypothetical protein J6590_014575 [Homalodisca vitripennis]